VISEKYRCIFVHIPKTAGQSVENFFLRLHGLSWEERAPLLLRHNPDPARGPERLAHLTAREYIDCGYVRDRDFRRYFSFSFVRNPWARLVSEYCYRERGQERLRTFKDFVLSAFSKKSDYSDDYRHLIPQSEFLCGRDGRLMVDFIGYFETLQRDFDIVCSRLGIPVAELPYANSSSADANQRTSPGKSEADFYVPYYDKELRQFVAEFYAADIQRFGYRFGS
jgi:hypothetical protein